jgi:hypothetical protein
MIQRTRLVSANAPDRVANADPGATGLRSPTTAASVALLKFVDL